MSQNIGKNMSKTLSGKYSPKLLYHAKQFALDALKTTTKRIIQKSAESALIDWFDLIWGDLIGN